MASRYTRTICSRCKCKTTRFTSLYRAYATKLNDQPKPVTDFPWLLASDPPRIERYPYPEVSGLWFIPTFLQRQLSNAINNGFLNGLTGGGYFPDEFSKGASLAFVQFAKRISNPTEKNIGDLEKMLTKSLFEKLEPYLRNKDGGSLKLDIPAVHDVRVIDNFRSFGGERRTDVISPMEYIAKGTEPSPEYMDALWTGTIPHIFRWTTVDLVLPTLQKLAARNNPEFAAKGIPRNAEGTVDMTALANAVSFSRIGGLLSESVQKGMQIAVDVAINADIEYQALNKDGSVGVYDKARREVIVRFDSGYISPSSRVLESWKNNSFRWRIADIDYLIEKQELQKRGEDV